MRRPPIAKRDSITNRTRLQTCFVPAFKLLTETVVVLLPNQYIEYPCYGFTIMDEAHRIAYLKHMGYEQYFSRYVLPRGKPSVIPAMIESVIDPEGQKESFVKTQHAGPTHVVAASSDIVRRPTAIAARESSSGPPTQEGSELVRAVKAKAENKQARNEELRFSVQFFLLIHGSQ